MTAGRETSTVRGVSGQSGKDLVEEYLSVFVAVTAEVASSTVARMGEYGGEIAQALWPSGVTPRAYTWSTLAKHAHVRATSRGLDEVAERLASLKAEALDQILRAEGVPGTSTIEVLIETTGELIGEWSDRIDDAKSHEERWTLARSGAVLQWQALLGTTALIALIPKSEGLVGPLERMIENAERMVARCARPELVPEPAREDVEALMLKREELRGQRLEAEARALEPERSPEETLARIERVTSELARIAVPLGAHIDRELFAGDPPSPTTLSVMVERMDERLNQERDPVVTDATASLDQALLQIGPPERGTESVLRRTTDLLCKVGEDLREAETPEQTRTLANAAELMIRLLTAHIVGVAGGTGETELVARLARVIGMD